MQGETDSADPGRLIDPAGQVGAPLDDRAVFLTDVGRGLTQGHVGLGIEVTFHKGKLVTAETWRKWSGARTAELWQAIALLCFIDPEAWTLERMRRVSACRFRLELALDQETDAFLDPLVVDPKEKARSIVRFDYVRRWAGIYLLPIPVMFPEGGAPIDVRLLNGPIEALARPIAAIAPVTAPTSATSGEAPSPPRGRPRKKSSSSDYVRSAELLEIVPFSRATLWRMVRDGKFPAPVKVAPRITAWKRTEVETWVAVRAAAAGSLRRAGKVDR